MGKSKKGKSKQDAHLNSNEENGALEEMAEEPGAEISGPKKGKEKGKGRKNKLNEDDLLEDLAALELESAGGQTAQEPPAPSAEPAQQPAGKKKKGGKKGKKDYDEDELLAEVAAIEAAGKDGGGGKGKKKEKSSEEGDKEAAPAEPPSAKETPKADPEPKQDQTAQSDKSKKDAVDEGEAEDAGPTMKTAAQKKAEKKERERKKKEAQREEARRKKQKEQAKSTESGGKDQQEKEKEEKTESVKEEVTETAKPGEGGAGEEGEAEEETGKKKKKGKKGAKGEDDEKKRKPNKGQLKAMQEALKKMKEEEERLKAEEEAKQRAAEKAEEERLEKLRREQERKAQAKLKKKERVERMKQEGTYLTKAQKEAKARKEAMLNALREQGVEVPMKEATSEESKPKRVVYGKRERKNKNRTQSVEATEAAEESAVNSEVAETASETVSMEAETTETKEDDVKNAVDAEDDVADNWDDMTDEEEGDQGENAVTAKTEGSMDDGDEDDDEEEDEEESEEGGAVEDKMPKAQITIKTQESKEDEDEEDDEEDDDDEDEESDSDEFSSDEELTKEEKTRQRVLQRIQKRKEQAEAKKSTDHLRSPVVCVLGHVDTGKTKILDKIRHSNVQDGEAGGITQQIGATMVPRPAIKDQTKMCREFAKEELKIPGLLIIDTPGHESFSNLRSRGSSLCDIAILVVDIMHGLEPQTIESINLLKQRKTPFVVALNKIDRLFEWKPSPHTDVVNTIKKQKRHTKDEFEERTRNIITEFAEQSLNAALFYDNPDVKTYISLVPTSAHSGDGMGNLIALIITLSQTLLAKRLAFSQQLQCTTLEVKSLPGLGTTIDVVLVNGRLREGDTIVVAGQEGPIVSQVRSLLMPQPLKELRVKNQYESHKEITGAQGVKVAAKDLEKALAGLPMLVAEEQDEVEILKEEVSQLLKTVLTSIKLSERGVYVQASTLGSLEALLEFLRTSKIPYSGINIGPVHKKDVMKASVMLEHDSQYAVILAFDVKVERDAQELADRENIRIFQADIIYHLFDSFMAYRDEVKKRNREQYKHIAVFPCKLRILPQCIFNARNPIVMGVVVEGGIVKQGTPIIVPSRENCELGVVSSLEMNHKPLETARKGQEICIKIENVSGDAPKMYGRHFDHNDMLISKISRESIDAVKDHFREDLEKQDWQVMIELKKILQIL